MRDALPVRVPVVAENDANAFAIGATYGRNEVHSGVTLFLVMESGVGGGIIVNGSLFRGANGLAGEDRPSPDRRRLAGRTGIWSRCIGLENIMQGYRRTSPVADPTFPDLPGRCPRSRARAP